MVSYFVVTLGSWYDKYLDRLLTQQKKWIEKMSYLNWYQFLLISMRHNYISCDRVLQNTFLRVTVIFQNALARNWSEKKS